MGALRGLRGVGAIRGHWGVGCQGCIGAGRECRYS